MRPNLSFFIKFITDLWFLKLLMAKIDEPCGLYHNGASATVLMVHYHRRPS